MKYLYFALIAILASCSSPKTEITNCYILDLEIKSHDDPDNKIMSYYKTNLFVEIANINQLLRFEDSSRVAFFFQPSANDSTKRKFTYKVKEGIIKTNNYQWDLIALVDNDKKEENIQYWLKSYNKYRKQVGHLDFAHWTANSTQFTSGRIDCDTTLHMILDNGKEDRIFVVDETGKNKLKFKKIKE